MINLIITVIVFAIGIFWYLANVFSKPVLNRIHNYYEDDKEGRTIANALIGVCIALSIWLGYLL